MTGSIPLWWLDWFVYCLFSAWLILRGTRVRLLKVSEDPLGPLCRLRTVDNILTSAGLCKERFLKRPRQCSLNWILSGNREEKDTRVFSALYGSGLLCKGPSLQDHTPQVLSVHREVTKTLSQHMVSHAVTVRTV